MSSRAIPQGRQPDLEDLEPVVEVLAEAAVEDGGPQVTIGGGHDAHVRGQDAGAAEALELLLLQDAQELRLRGQAHFPDLVEEQHAARGALDLAGLRRARSRECALLVTEQLRLQQLIGQGRAVQRDEGTVGLAGRRGAGDAPPPPCRFPIRRGAARWCRSPRPAPPASGPPSRPFDSPTTRRRPPSDSISWLRDSTLLASRAASTRASTARLSSSASLWWARASETWSATRRARSAHSGPYASGRLREEQQPARELAQDLHRHRHQGAHARVGGVAKAHRVEAELDRGERLPVARERKELHRAGRRVDHGDVPDEGAPVEGDEETRWVAEALRAPRRAGGRASRRSRRPAGAG